MTTPSDGGSGFQDPEAMYGGADSVPDTPGVPAHGTEPEEARSGTARARVGSGGGIGPGLWIVIALVVLVALVYLAFLR
jgi:hypothetical protein